MDQIAELARRMESLIRLGTIAEVDHSAARVRIKTGNLVTDWLPWTAARAGSTREWNPPTFGEQVVILSPSGDPAAGVILPGGVFSDGNGANSASPDEHARDYPDGARILYNHATGALEATGIKTALVQASKHCTVDCPETTITGNVLIKGALTVKKLLTYQAGMSGMGGDGGDTTIHGPINHVGDLTNRGTVSSNGVVLDMHTHPGDSGGTTGGPQ